jgi:hypothetical protein
MMLSLVYFVLRRLLHAATRLVTVGVRHSVRRRVPTCDHPIPPEARLPGASQDST